MFWVFSNIVTTLRSMFRQKNASLIIGKHCIKKWTLPTPAVDEDNIPRSENKDTCGGFPWSRENIRRASTEVLRRVFGTSRAGATQEMATSRRRRPACHTWNTCVCLAPTSLNAISKAQFAEEDSQKNSFPTEMKAAFQFQLFACLSIVWTLCAWFWPKYNHLSFNSKHVLHFKFREREVLCWWVAIHNRETAWDKRHHMIFAYPTTRLLVAYNLII